MPTYDYVCDACEHTWEHYQSMTDKPLKKCPECGKRKARRQIGTGAGVIFKGSGFYETDYRSESYREGAKADSGTSGGGDAKKSEAKSEAPSSDSSASDSSPSSNSGSQQSDD